MPKRRKPVKPYPEFPLYAHRSGQWAKTIGGRTVYFGTWDDPTAALEKFLRERDYLYAGKAPPPEQDGTTLDELVNRYLAAKRAQVDLGEITMAHWHDCTRDGKHLLDALGRHRVTAALQPGDFARLRAHLSKGRNATTVTGMIVRIRSIFRWGEMTKLTPRPDYGMEFSLPKARARRQAARQRSRFFSPEEIRRILKAAENKTIYPMILLGINCGLGNTDCAELKHDHVDLDAGILDYPRVKTATDRRAALWPKTVEAIRAQATDPSDSEHVFRTRNGLPYVRLLEGGTWLDAIAGPFNKLLVELDIKRPGLGFYGLRHTYRTVADETRDWPAVDLTMGHVAADRMGAPYAVAMGDRYRERIDNDRLRAIAEHVQEWLRL